MDIWFPRIPARRLPAMAIITMAGALVAGLYGAVHDQLSYSISPEYFERMKFQQFKYANFGWPPRIFVAEIGFLASWWVGLIGGWILARVGLAELRELSPRNHVVCAIALMVVVAAIVGIGGALLGIAVTRSGDLSRWEDWRQRLGVRNLRAFVVVAYLHGGSYLGAVIGLVCAVGYVRRRLVHIRNNISTAKLM